MWKVDKKKYPKLVKVLNVISFALKIIAGVCFGVVFLCVVCKCAYDKASSGSTGYISAKADEGVAETALTGDEMNGTINDFDITNYPSANYFNIENYKGDNGGFITVSNGVVNSIVVVATENTVYGVSLGTTLAEFCPELIAGETYTLSFELSSDLARNAIRLNLSGNSAGVYWYNGQSRTIDASDLSSPVYLYPLSSPGVMPDGKCVWSSIMINKGTEVMPYFPYFKSLYNVGYKNGEDNALSGFMVGSTISASVQVTDGDIVQDHTYNNSLLLTNGGFSLRPVYFYFRDIPLPGEPTYNYIKYTINFGGAILLDDFLRLYKVVDVSNPFNIFTDLLLTTYSDGSGTKYRISSSVNTDTGSLSILTNELPSTVNPSLLFVKGMSMDSLEGIRSIDPFFSYELYPQNIAYNKAFNEGFNTGVLNGEGYLLGIEDGFSQGEKYGYNKGFNDGKEIGYNDGLSVGFQDGFNQTQNGGFTWLISSVQAFLDVNFFGDFGVGTLLFVGLGMTLVTLFLKMFAGG